MPSDLSPQRHDLDQRCADALSLPQCVLGTGNAELRRLQLIEAVKVELKEHGRLVMGPALAALNEELRAVIAT